MKSFDIISAFTYEELDKVIYMRQSERYYQRDPNVVYKLHKPLYGLKKSAIYIYSKRDMKIIIPVFIKDITLVSKDNSAMISIV